jgi:hypothetical protein
MVMEHKSKVQYCIREGAAEEQIDQMRRKPNKSLGLSPKVLSRLGRMSSLLFASRW